MPPDLQDRGTFRQLMRHFIEEMTWKMVCACGFIAFFFFYGATNALIKWSGRRLESLSTQPGPLIGLGCALLLVVGLAAIKLRPRT